VARVGGRGYFWGMNTATFDKLAYVDALRAGGVPEDQARVHANALDSALRDTVATKEDLRGEASALRADFKAEFADVRAELKGDIADVRGEIAALRAELKAGIAALRAELKGDIADVRGEIVALRGEMKAMIAEARADMMKWMIALLLGQTALIAALVRLL
jgi:hypothetical protein